jgi:DNA-binding MarR family transcriptional regulator
LEVQVLNESHWPISGTQKFPLLLGKELLQCQKQFQEFYDKTTEKRRLQWLYNYGTVTLSARFTNSKLPIQLVLTPLQASILMCFNENPKMTFDELLTALWPTQASGRTVLTSSQSANALHDMSLEEILRFAIQPLVYFKYKVISKENDADPKKESIKKGDVFLLRDKIPAKKLPRKIQFPPGSAKQTQKEANQDHEQVMKQREFEVEAAMVRVMKARNRLDWNQLQVEVISILKERFAPDAKMLKKRLESLIERRFFERDENDPKILIYIS